MDLSDPIDRAALALFLELERDPKRAKPFSDDTRRLARMLGLIEEWWRGQSPCDRSAKPYMPSHLCAFGDWYKCRRVRQELLKLAREAGQLEGASSPASTTTDI